MSFKAPVFTNKGKQLYASCLAGKNEIIFTNIKLGDGELMAQAIADLEDLVNPIKTIVLNDKKLIGNDQVLIRAVFKNIDIDTGFYWREVGLYAQDPENPEDLWRGSDRNGKRMEDPRWANLCRSPYALYRRGLEQCCLLAGGRCHSGQYRLSGTGYGVSSGGQSHRFPAGEIWCGNKDGFESDHCDT